MRKRLQDIPLLIVKYAILVAGTMAVVVPIVVVLFASLKGTEEYRATAPLVPPENWFNFENYVEAFVDGNMLTGFVNTAIIMAVALAGAIILSSMVAYILSRFSFPGKRLIVAAFLFAILIPGVTTQVSIFQVINALGLFNTRMAAIILFMGTDIIAIYIFLQFLNSSVSRSLDESAMMDGASYLTIYARIILPLLKPAISTVLILRGVIVYNDFYIPFLYMPRRGLQVISTALFRFIGPYGRQWEIISAAVIITAIPTLIVFLLLQKYIYNGFVSGAIK